MSGFRPALSVLTTGDRNVVTVPQCMERGALVNPDGRERHLSWHRGQAGELSPPVMDQRVAELVRAAWRICDAYDRGDLPGSAYTADLIDAAEAFHPDEVRP